jgi:hypothetical protein
MEWAWRGVLASLASPAAQVSRARPGAAGRVRGAAAARACLRRPTIHSSGATPMSEPCTWDSQEITRIVPSAAATAFHGARDDRGRRPARNGGVTVHGPGRRPAGRTSSHTGPAGTGRDGRDGHRGPKSPYQGYSDPRRCDRGKCREQEGVSRVGVSLIRRSAAGPVNSRTLPGWHPPRVVCSQAGQGIGSERFAGAYW